ncbi:MAG: hypothetical protein HY301_09780 [Verrucomicrobia bacterium]|nr:hypothetical protein [Verrucomicrobiota bacterium]
MKSASVKQFLALRESLQSERATILARLREIDRALGGVSASVPAAAPAKVDGRTLRRGLKRMKNPMSLKAAIAVVTKARPLSKDDILKGIAKLGYRFATSDPLNTLNSVLYAKKQYKNTDGKFAPAK